MILLSATQVRSVSVRLAEEFTAAIDSNQQLTAAVSGLSSVQLQQQHLLMQDQQSSEFVQSVNDCLAGGGAWEGGCPSTREQTVLQVISKGMVGGQRGQQG